MASRGKDLPQLLRQRGKFALNNVPDDIDVDLKVMVGQDITQTSNLSPFDFGMSNADGLWNHLRRLANDQQIADHGVYGLAIAGKLFARKVDNVGIDLSNSLPHVFEIDLKVPGHERPPARWRQAASA